MKQKNPFCNHQKIATGKRNNMHGNINRSSWSAIIKHSVFSTCFSPCSDYVAAANISSQLSLSNDGNDMIQCSFQRGTLYSSLVSPKEYIPIRIHTHDKDIIVMPTEEKGVLRSK